MATLIDDVYKIARDTYNNKQIKGFNSKVILKEDSVTLTFVKKVDSVEIPNIVESTCYKDLIECVGNFLNRFSNFKSEHNIVKRVLNSDYFEYEVEIHSK